MGHTNNRKLKMDFVLLEVWHAQKLFFMQKTIDIKNVMLCLYIIFM
ncbi:protein of unknown function [Candidatus Nitrotoga arctica]|uniref:Uncharacterized protein n=1 Tax=Candidatus Nitrotoga arctica TaxID=453162 RepID=A0ABN8AR75_9PROT|nr:protein of unknown function [Candidatus Nitrotoga arctica]